MVAQVISIQKQATNIVYNLDDGTGRLEARHWVDPSAMEEDDEAPIVYVTSQSSVMSQLTIQQRQCSDIPHGQHQSILQ